MFIDIEFPRDVALGSRGGPERRTDIVTLRSGAEERNSIWANSRRKYNASYGVKTFQQLKNVVDFFEMARGRLHTFKFWDAVDNASCATGSQPRSTDQNLGVGDGSNPNFHLIKKYGEINPYSRLIKHPSDLMVGLDGVITEDYVFMSELGVIVFHIPPDAGVEVTVGYTFHVPVRFDIDYLELSASNFNAGSVPSIDLLEVLK